MKRLSRQMVPYIVTIWVAFLALSGMAPYCDLYAAEAPHSHAGKSESGYSPTDHAGGGAAPHHLGDTATLHDHDSPHPHCCQISNADYDVAKTGLLVGDIRIPTPVFLLVTVGGLLPRQAIDALLERPSVDPPPPKQPLYLLTERFLI